MSHNCEYLYGYAPDDPEMTSHEQTCDQPAAEKYRGKWLCEFHLDVVMMPGPENMEKVEQL